MYIATVVPIKKGWQKENLSYFSANDIPLGSIVTVQIKSREVDAIVINMEDARLLKTDLRGMNYQLKKIIKVKGMSPFKNSFFVACQKMKVYTASTTGNVIKNLLPSVFLENLSLLKETTAEEEIAPDTKIKNEKLIFQTSKQDRMSWYRTLIREEFAKKQSIFICVPTRYDIEEFKKELSKGIEQYVYAFHSEINKKALINSYNDAVNETHPIVIIGTGIFLSIPRYDIKTLIVEHESAGAYKQFVRPYIDIRSFAEILASIEKIKLIFGDTLLRPETLQRHEIGELAEIHPPLFRLPPIEQLLVIDMKKEVTKTGIQTFNVLSDKTVKMIEYGLKNSEPMFLFSVRKGLAGVTVCHDCGNTLLCPQCSTPVVLYGAKQRTATKANTPRIFMCNKCGHKETTETRCMKCNSWNLTPLGIGTDRVYEEVQRLFPEAKIIQINKESTPTDKEARNAIEIFHKNPGSILIGTEMAFSYLHTQVIHSAIISLDGLLSIPNFNISQKVLHIIEKLHSMTKRNLIVQTRIPDNKTLEYILSGNVLPLYREDLKERKIFGYPPFKRLIKITFTGTTAETEKARSYIDHVLGVYEPQIFSAFIGKVKGQYITNTVIKLDPTLWPLINGNEETRNKISEILSNLPPSFSVNIDPEDLL